MQKMKNFWQPDRLRQITDPRNIGLYIFAIVVLAIGWSGAKAVQKNYELQKQIAILQQENNVIRLSNQTTYLQNQYYETDQFLELSARRNFGLAAPGETVLLVPEDVALRYLSPDLRNKAEKSEVTNEVNRSGYAANLEDWRNFLLGRQLFDY